MRIVTSTSLAAIVASAVLAAGCGGGAATTQPSMAAGSGTNMTPPTTEPTTEPTAAPAMAGATHVLTQDEPYYVDVPNGGSVPAGVLKAGTPVLMMVPGTTYCKVLSNQGKGCYTLTAGLKPISNK
jgi:hypothetical protein